jgi:hypothetical protein
MKTIIAKHYLLILATSLIAPAAFAQSGGGFDLSWSTIDGGGGSSSGGNFILNSTIGQPDAGALSGGLFTLAGGFWGVMLPDAPKLRITLSGSNIAIFWPDPSTRFQLQEAGTLPPAPASWTNVGQTPSVANGEKQVTLPRSAATRFYRLTKP